MKKQNLGWIIAGVLILVMLSYIGFLFLNSQVEKGIEEGIIIGQEKMIIQINEQGVVPVIMENDEEVSVDWINIQEVCGNLKWKEYI